MLFTLKYSKYGSVSISFNNNPDVIKFKYVPGFWSLLSASRVPIILSLLYELHSATIFGSGILLSATADKMGRFSLIAFTSVTLGRAHNTILFSSISGIIIFSGLLIVQSLGVTAFGFINLIFKFLSLPGFVNISNKNIGTLVVLPNPVPAVKIIVLFV